MYKSIFLKYVQEINIADVISYGNKQGKFITNEYTLTKYALDNVKNSEYCFVPIKKEYYVLNWDFDFKINKYDILLSLESDIHNIFNSIISEIISTINNTFINPNIEYIYATKNIDYGVHIYFPNIIVNKNIHSYIYNITRQNIINKNILPFEIIDIIFDPCITKTNGLRLFYYRYNNNYYFPNKELSTYKFDVEPEKHFKYCLINTNTTELSYKLKIPNEEIENIIFNIDKKKRDIDIKNNFYKENIEYINDFNFIQLESKKQMFLELINILSIKRFNDYHKWIQLIFLFKTYGLYNEIIEFSKKSVKFDNESIKIITKIFNKKRIPKDYLTIGSLIKWCTEDNFNKTIIILEKYNINLKLNIKNVDEILLTHNNKINFTEDSKYITKDAIEEVVYNIDNEKYNAFLLQSATGSGKTTACTEILKICKKNNFSILFIVTRRSMCSTILTAFNYIKNKNGELIKNKEFNFVSYLDKNIENDDMFISSLEHLFVFRQFYDVVVLDEIFSLCSYLYSDTLIGRRKDCLTHLKNLIDNSRIVIGLDAQIGDICFELFSGKSIYFYKNIFKNKIDIPFNIFISKHSSDNSNLTKIASIIGEQYCKDSRSVIIFSDRKNTTIKMHELLKFYNKNDDYFRIFNANCGTIEDLNNIDLVSKNRCIISSPKIVYGLDLTTSYEDIYCIYSKTKGTNSLSSFEWYQQLSRARFSKAINIFILDSKTNNYDNTYISFEKNKVEENKHIENYIYYKKSLYEKYNLVSEITSINTYFRNIHYYKSWYDKIFSNNKLHILKLLANQTGYIINETDFDSLKIKTDLNKKVKLNFQIQKDICLKIINNEPIEMEYYNYIPNLREQIKNRQKYIKESEKDYNDILCDEQKFINYIKKKLLDLSKEDFEKKILKINNEDLPEVMKDNVIFKQIDTLFWIENNLGIKRYEVNKIDSKINIKNIKKIFLDNIDKFFFIFNDGRSKKYVEKRINKNISKIETHNRLQKFYVDIINVICSDIIKIKMYITKTNNIKVFNYFFKL